MHQTHCCIKERGWKPLFHNTFLKIVKHCQFNGCTLQGVEFLKKFPKLVKKNPDKNVAQMSSSDKLLN